MDSFLNTPASHEKKSKKKKSENINEDDQDASLWRQDDKIVKANNDCFDQRSGADTSQQVDAIRTLWAEISDIAGIDMDTIQNANNFYSFDRQRAKDEIDYRKALKTELDKMNDDASRLSSLPRTNN